MYNFKKILGLAGAAVVFAGIASAQNVTCTNPNATPGANLIRAEGMTEQVADLTFTCTNTTAAAVNINLLVFTSLPVTSKVLNTSGTAFTEASVVLNNSAVVTTQGTVSGSQITFSQVPIAVGAQTVTITNVRVNATSLNVSTGAPPAVTESVFVSGGVSVNSGTLNATNVAFALSGLSVTKLTGTGASGSVPTPAICTSLSGVNSFTVNFGENFPTAFKTQGGAGNNTLGSEFANNTETGFVPPAGFPNPPSTNVTNIANSATRIKITFGNVPSGLTIFAPQTLTGSAGSTLSLVASETGSTAPVSVASGNGAPANNGVVTGGVAVYEVTTQNAGLAETFSGNFSISVGANNVGTTPNSPITVAVSLAPTGATSNIPNFAASTATAMNATQFSLCSTSLLFPFVTNQLGFDTGIAIANTSADPFGKNGAPNQTGTCTLNFYGDGTPSTPMVVTPAIGFGKVFTRVLSADAPGFQGYIIAQCAFQYAHGFAFVTDGVGANGGLSQGYLALVLPSAGGARATGAVAEALAQ